jgi:hypothetical protein
VSDVLREAAQALIDRYDAHDPRWRNDLVALRAALASADTTQTLWEGESWSVRSQPGYPDDPGMSQLPFGVWLDCPPGTRVRVVTTGDPT